MSRPFVLGIAGYKNSGKTTLAERLIGELTRRGLAVASIKHAHHEADVDTPGRDSYRHRVAGAQEVALVTSRRVALMHELRGAPEPALDAVIARLSPCDIVIVEGFKSDPIPKIEVRRTGQAGPPLAPSPHVVAIASDGEAEGLGIPVLALDDTNAIADFILDLRAKDLGCASLLGRT